LIGPPCDTLKSHTLLSASPAASPCFFASAVLSLCMPSLAAEKNDEPWKLLPPSFGIMLARTPPAEVSALMALVW
jgi:hypothetical protein